MSKLVLTEIWIYPIKSLGGIRLRSAQVFEKGLKNDRRWMLIDRDNNFLTQRVHHSMALFTWSETNGQWSIHFKSDSIAFPFLTSGKQTTTHPLVKAKIWDDEVEVFEVSKEYSQWFSEKLNIDCRLVSFPEENLRPVDANYQINRENVSLADAYPFLIIGEESLADLNHRLNEPVPMNRFRPNFVFSGGDAYAEDHWKNFSIGKNKFAAVKRCARCVLTTVNQNTGEKGVEPLATLAGYRKENNKVFFGQNVLAINHTEIHEGDEITLED
ncbi:MAG: MOSC domain-containing protein [Bacteroidetes bacterium]|nr:MOSC domain-containing protein [Bacteroidota bacterium]